MSLVFIKLIQNTLQYAEMLSAHRLSVGMYSCGYNATCSVRNHVPQCGRDPGYTGDAFTACQRLTTPPAPTEVIDPCNPSPCGENANARTEIGQEHVNASLNTWGILT